MAKEEAKLMPAQAGRRPAEGVEGAYGADAGDARGDVRDQGGRFGPGSGPGEGGEQFGGEQVPVGGAGGGGRGVEERDGPVDRSSPFASEFVRPASIMTMPAFRARLASSMRKSSWIRRRRSRSSVSVASVGRR